MKAWERGVGELESIWQILAAARSASSKPYQPCPKKRWPETSPPS